MKVNSVICFHFEKQKTLQIIIYREYKINVISEKCSKLETKGPFIPLLIYTVLPCVTVVAAETKHKWISTKQGNLVNEGEVTQPNESRTEGNCDILV